MLGPGSPVLDIMRGASLPRIEVDRGDALPDFINVIAMCMATVDLPDPPFSLATITRVADTRASMNRCEGLRRY